jgi:membrane-associated protease RseP (regulator of RpoE activity)
MYIAIFVFAIAFFIMFHEFGHFATAKLFGMKAERFFLGFGPTLWSTHRGETEYGVKAIPAGGFVKISGMSPFEDNDPADHGRLFYEQPAWKRLIVLSAGSATHFVAAFLLLFAALGFVGLPVGGEVTAVVEQLEPAGPAAAAGMQPGDEIVAIDGEAAGDTETIRELLAAREGQTVPVSVVRDGTERELEVALASGQEQDGQPVYLGVAFSVVGSQTVPLGVADGFREVTSGELSFGRLVSLSLQGIAQVFSPAGIAGWVDSFGAEERSAEGPVSLVGAGQIVNAFGQSGDLFAVLLVFAQLNIVLGTLNMLPLPPLDGGHIAALAVEESVNGVRKLRGKRERWLLDPAKLTPIALAVILFFGMIFMGALYLDIVNPASGIIE